MPRPSNAELRDRHLRAMRALTHPVRFDVVELALSLELEREQAGERVDWSPKELAELLERPLPNISYHVKIVRELGFLDLKRTIARRGAMEHRYRFHPFAHELVAGARAWVNGDASIIRPA